MVFQFHEGGISYFFCNVFYTLRVYLETTNLVKIEIFFTEITIEKR